MMHRQLGVVRHKADDKFVVRMYNNKTEDVFKTKKEAIEFIEHELTDVVRTYGFLACYKYIDLVEHKVSYVLLDKMENHDLAKYELTKFEYVKTHFFYFSKDERRKIIDWKNPDFQQMTRHSLSSRRLTQFFWLGASLLSIIFTAILLGMFAGMINNNYFDRFIAFSENDWITSGMLIGFLVTGLILQIVVGGLYLFRVIKYHKLVHTGSKWHEKYSHVDWRHYERIVSYTNWITLVLSLVFGVLLIMFGVFYSMSPFFEGYETYSAVALVNNMLYPVIIFFAFNLAGSAYYIYRFHAEIGILKRRLLTPEGKKMYDHWLKNNDVLPHNMKSAFHPIDDHAIYPNTKYPKENEKSLNLQDDEIGKLLLRVKTYENLIIKARLHKEVNIEDLNLARINYLELVSSELHRK